ncbi:AMP-binding protein [Caldimonas brevitalea]|uniref:Beta-ketoacyl synthase n=1 Tax=Caldimonas brevitalea TaxID=413882 RepID=A0A0G3BNH6_9BURK|nr:AMP-binding protein [Caldimonas brevitalea]AKJ30952.1 beta-ketoacyl synthase [Caldimonas brevitalea]
MPSDTAPSGTADRPALVHGGPLDHPIARHVTLADALSHAAAHSGERGFVFVDAQGHETRWTYRELHEAARRAAALLQAQGHASGSRIVLRLGDPRGFALALWTCILGGYAAVPTADTGPLPSEPEAVQALGASLQALDPAVLIVPAAQAAQAVALKDRHGWSRLAVLTPEQLLEAPPAPPDAAPQGAPGDTVALIFPTSGSTGTPKPVTQTGTAILSMCAGSAQMNGFDAEDVFLNWMPLEHVGAVVFLHLLPVCVQAEQVHVEHRRVRERMLGWLDLLTRHKASVTWVPSHVFNIVAKAVEQGETGAWDLRALRFLVNAGESISSDFAHKFALQLQRYGLRADAIRPAFGMSETCSGITWASALQVHDERYVDLGAPIPGAALRIVGADGQLLCERQVGQLQVQGPSVTRGYYRAARDEKFLSDGWFDTGDRGFLHQGRLHLTDREGDAIEIDGTQLHGYELEAAIEALPGVLAGHVAVCSVLHAGRATLAAFYCGDPTRAETAALQAHVEAVLAGLAPQVPRIVVALAPHELPRTSIGKIQRKVLRRRLERAPQAAGTAVRSTEVSG